MRHTILSQLTGPKKNALKNTAFLRAFFRQRRTRGSNPQPLTGYLSSSEAAHQLAYPPGRLLNRQSFCPLGSIFSRSRNWRTLVPIVWADDHSSTRFAYTIATQIQTHRSTPGAFRSSSHLDCRFLRMVSSAIDELTNVQATTVIVYRNTNAIASAILDATDQNGRGGFGAAGGGKLTRTMNAVATA